MVLLDQVGATHTVGANAGYAGARKSAAMVAEVGGATTSESVSSSAACMCGNGCMSMDGGFQAVRAAVENLQIRTLLKTKTVFIG